MGDRTVTNTLQALSALLNKKDHTRVEVHPQNRRRWIGADGTNLRKKTGEADTAGGNQSVSTFTAQFHFCDMISTGISHRTEAPRGW